MSSAANSNMIFYSDVLRSLRSPFVRMCYGKMVLDRINNRPIGPNNLLNLKYFWNEIFEKTWLSCESGIPVKSKPSEIAEPQDDPVLFPVIKTYKQKKMEMVYAVDYMDVLYRVLVAYLSYTRLTDVLVELDKLSKDADANENRLNASSTAEKSKLFCHTILVDSNLVSRYATDAEFLYKLRSVVNENCGEHRLLKRFNLMLHSSLKPVHKLKPHNLTI